MSEATQTLASLIQKELGDVIEDCVVQYDEITLRVAPELIQKVCLALRDTPEFKFELLIDLCGVDYLKFPKGCIDGYRFASVYHLLSVENNQRVRVKAFLKESSPMIDSVTSIWSVADWFEREAFDLFGILYNGHPDLRRLLTDYGFIGHPFRKDFPLIGHVEMRYDDEQKRVVYEPVSIEPRINIPHIVRDDNRYVEGQAQGEDNG